MIAFKGFNKDLQATLGKGTFQFAPGKTYVEKKCKCAHNGFHCAENPLCALGYYRSTDSRYFIVEALGDINQDGIGSRISCTKIKLVKEITRIQLGELACEYIRKYPKRESEGDVSIESGRAIKDDFVIVRGKKPVAAGETGSYLFLVKECKESSEIESIEPLYVDGEIIKANKYYGIGGKPCRRKNS